MLKSDVALGKSELQVVAPARRLLLPTRYMQLEPLKPLSAYIDDPIFSTRSAAMILGVDMEVMKKWRQRSQGPDYYQYGVDGAVRYALSALLAFKKSCLVIPGGQR